MNKTTLYIVAAAMLMAGCAKDPTLPDAGSITVEASIGSMSKVAYSGAASAFEEGDRIAVYAWTGSAAEVPATRVVDGVVNILGEDGKWTPASPMYWNSGSDSHYFLGVSPAHRISDFTADAISLSTDYASDDLLVARNLDGLKPGSGTVALPFGHVLAKLTVNLRLRNEFGDSPTVSVAVTARSGATVNYLTGDVSATGDASAINLTTSSAATGYTHSFSGIQIPQGGVRAVTVTVNGWEYEYTAGEDIPLTAGHHTTLGFILGKDMIELSGVSVSDWSDGGALPGGEAIDFLSMPLTLEAAEAGAQVTFALSDEVTNPVEYRTWDGTTWSDWSVYVSNAPITLASIGDKVQFRGDNVSYSDSTIDGSSHIGFEGDCYVYGNIMSLIRKTGFRTVTELTGNYVFCYLFRNNPHLLTNPAKPLLLPATTLTNSCYSCLFEGCTALTVAPDLPAMTMAFLCYEKMFSNCTSLTVAPDLPATTLAMFCYDSMFESCSGLTVAPAHLPATTLPDDCYYGMFSDCKSLAVAPVISATTLSEHCCFRMFSGCSSLRVAPELPAKTMAISCYGEMFYDCENLTVAPELPATTLADKCYLNMFFGCPNLKVAATILPATTLAKSCYEGMFSACENLANAPVLPAEKLEESCYQRMFAFCHSLKSITCLATDISAPKCTDQWLQTLYPPTSPKTFYKAASMTGWPAGESGIPEGWDVQDYVAIP